MRRILMCALLMYSFALGTALPGQSSAAVLGDSLHARLGWYAICPTGVVGGGEGQYRFSGSISQCPAAEPQVGYGPFGIVSGFWSSECDARFGSPSRPDDFFSSLGPGVFRLYPNSPNPFRQGTRIRYDLPVTSQVNLCVYDITGRQVRELVNGLQKPGRYALRWDGKDAQGRNCASGVYFLSVNTDDHNDVRKMLIAE